MKSNQLLLYVRSHARELVAHALATVVVAVYLFNPSIGTSISRSLLLIAPGLLSLNGILAILLGYLLTPILLGIFCAIIILVYQTLGIKSPYSSVVLGVAASYVPITWLAVFIKISVPGSIVYTMIVYMLFFGFFWIFSKHKQHIAISATIGSIFILATLYFAPHVTAQLENKQYETTAVYALNTAIKNLGFTAYYPAYTYSALPNTPAKLNGYTNQRYSNQTVTFLLGKAQVRESAILTNQDKVMNFTNNCDIGAILGSMETSSSITSFELQASLDNYKKCDMIQLTPSGKKVYFAKNGQWTFFYTQIKNTNIILSFDDINTQKYDSSQLPEILKIIDSLQPISNTELHQGNAFGISFE